VEAGKTDYGQGCRCPKTPKQEAAYTARVTRQFSDKPTRSQSTHGLFNSHTNQLSEMFDLKFGNSAERLRHPRSVAYSV